MNQRNSSWDRLNRFARSIKIESISVLGFSIQFNPQALGIDSFYKLLAKAKQKPTTRNDIYVLSAHNIDQINTVDKIDPDHECEALSEPVHAPGGSGANTAYTLGRLGAKVKVTGIVGDDMDGKVLSNSLSEAKVDVTEIYVDKDYPTGKTLTLVEEGGKRLIVVFPGANNHFAEKADSEAIVESAAASRIVHLSSFVGENEQRLQEQIVHSLPSDSFVSLTPGALYARQGLDRLQNLISHVDVIFLYVEQLIDLIENSSASVHNRGADVQRLMEAFFTWKQKHSISRPQILVVKDRLGDTSGTIDSAVPVRWGWRLSLEKYISPKQLPKRHKDRCLGHDWCRRCSG